MKLCECGCGKEITKVGNKYIHGHNPKGKKKGPPSKETREKQSESHKHQISWWIKKGLENPSKNPNVAKKIGDSHRGRTKENDEGIRITSKKKTGRTKENNESVKRMSESLTGRSKETHEGIRRRAEKIKGRTKETYEYLRIAGKKHSSWMKIHGNEIRKLIKRRSKAETKLYDIIKALYSTSKHTYKVIETKDYDVDIAIPEYKIIIEYDGWYHFDTEEHKEYHKRRQQEIEKEGWKFLRYNIFQLFPSKEKVKSDILSLLP